MCRSTVLINDYFTISKNSIEVKLSWQQKRIADQGCCEMQFSDTGRRQ
jgi:hypothetical protein